MNVTILSGLQAVVTSCIGVVLIAACAEGYLFGRMNWVLRAVSLLGALRNYSSAPVSGIIRETGALLWKDGKKIHEEKQLSQIWKCWYREIIFCKK